MSRIIVDFYIGLINIILIIFYISGVILCFYYIPDEYFGVYFKWIFSIIIPFLVEVVFFGPALLFVDMRNSLRVIENLVTESKYSELFNQKD